MNVRLRALTMDDYQVVLAWSKDDNFCSANGWKKNANANELYDWWRNCVSDTRGDFIRFGLEYNGKLVGYVDLAHIKEKTAELGIAIGESTLWGRGIGYHAARCVMNYAAKELGITTFDAETHSINQRAVRLIENLGFNEISRIGTQEYMGITSELIQYRLVVAGASR